MATTYAIPDGRTVMAVTTYSGTGASQVVSNAVNGVSMQPDFVWFKRRNVAENHWLVDVIRGVSNGVYSNLTNAEASQPTAVSSFNSNGFTVGADTTGYTNASGSTYVGWQWNAGGSTVTNTSGSITSSVRANTTAGFSVVGYTGTGANATVGHGLSVAPSMIITKVRSTTGADWNVYHASVGDTKSLFLNTTAVPSTSVNFWNNTSPTSTVFSVGTSGGTNNSGNTMIAYCFAPVDGYSKFGSYTGNGSTDGPFVFFGFSPRFVLFKRTDVVDDWVIHDSSRNTYNVVDDFLKPNLSNAEGAYATSGHGVDFLSSGIKLRTDSTQINASTGTYIYAAFAENPFKYANAR